MKRILVIISILVIAAGVVFGTDLTIWVSWEGEDFYRAAVREFSANTGKTV